MQPLHAGIHLDGFFHRLARARRRVLLLDYDGTLAPFHRRPERALPYPEVGPLLKRAIERCRTRVIIVSGRQRSIARLSSGPTSG